MAEYLSKVQLNPVGQCKLCLIRDMEKRATHYCIDCNALICDGCEVKHKGDSFVHSHVIQRVAITCSAAMPCQTHPDESATCWCDTCKASICASCMLYDHVDHERKDITKYFSELTSEDQTLETTLLNLKTNFLRAISVISGMLSRLDAHVILSEEAIRSPCRAMMKQILKTEQDLITKLKLSQQYSSHNLKNEANVMTQNIDEINSWLNIQTSVHSCVDTNSIIHRLVDLVVEGRGLAIQEPAIVPATDFVEFKAKDNLEIGELEVSCGCLNIKPVWNLQTEGSVETLTWIFDDMLAVLYDTSIKLYDVSPDDVVPTLSSVTSLENHNMSSMAASGLTLYITCRHADCETVHQYNITRGQLVENANQWQRNMFDSPCGIAVTASQNIVVSDFNRKQVSMHRSDGTRLLTIGQDTGVSLVKPVYVDSGTDYIIVSDWGTHYVYLFDMEGKLITQFGGHGSETGQLDSPHGICTDLGDNIIVADKRNGRISEFNCHGDFTCHILTNHFADISEPRAIDLKQIGQKTFLVVYDIGDPNPGMKLFEI